MLIFKDYASLIDSPLFDQYIISIGRNSYVVLPLLLLLGGPLESLVPIISLMLGPYIPDPIVKRIFNWLVIFWVWSLNVWSWMIILIFIECMYNILRFGIPYLLDKASTRLTPDPSVETLFRRLCRLLRRANRRDVTILFELYSNVISYGQRDISEAFDDNERQKFRKFFTDFSQTCFIIDDERHSITIFFPSFVIRASPQGVQITSDEAVKLIRSSEKTEEICAIYREELGDITVKLKCNHQYCLNCIFNWLNQRYVCPLCQTEIN